MALDLFLKGSNRPVIRGTLKDISDALWEVQESINNGSFGIDAASVTFDPTSTDMSATDVDAAIKANWTDIRNIDIDGNTRTILIRADTAANLASADAVLAEFELVYESDTGLSKLGDGATAYTLLPYTSAGSLQYGDVIPEPGLVESDGSGAWSPDYSTEIDGYGIVTFARATGDVTAGPLELKWPTMPVGATHNIRFVEAATITAVTRVFTLNCNWSDGAGVGVLEIDEGTKTWDDFAPAVGDTISGGPFGTPTTIAALISTTVIHTTTLPGETGSGDINLTAPADSIDGVRTITTPTMGLSGAVMVLSRLTESTETSRGELISGERFSDYYDNTLEGLLAAETQQDAIDELAVDAAAAAAAIYALQSAGGSDATVDWSIPTPTANGSQVIVITSAHFALSADAGVIKSRIVRILNSNDPANATTVELPKDGVAGTASCVLFFDPTQTGDITLKTTDNAGTVDGATSITIPGGARRFILVAPIVNSGGTNAAYSTNYDAGASFTGLVSFGAGISNPTITASGALTVATHSGKTVITSGNVTVPSTNGFCCTIIAGGSHTVGAGGATEALTVGQSISVISDGTNVWFTPIITLDTLPTS